MPLSDDLAVQPVQQAADLIALDDALREFSLIDERKSRIVELRYFAGLGISDIAAVLGISPATVKREWTVARLWLLRRISGNAHDS